MNLALRIITASILIPLFFLCLWLGGLYLTALLSLIFVLAAYELVKIALPIEPVRQMLLVLLSTILLFCIIYLDDPGLLFVALFMFLTSTMALGLDSKNFMSYAVSLVFLVYICFGLSSIFLVFDNYGGGAIYTVFFVLVATWSNDSFAYFFGKAYGKHKLAPSISPNKSWEGFIAGLVGNFLVPILFYYCFLNIPNFDLNLDFLLLLFLIAPCAILVPLGDLIESKVKRVYAVKDSGGLLPGHGGVLDRIDAMLLTMPWVLVYYIVINR